MTDVARRAGCSQSTVSIVLNGTNAVRIAEATKERVREAARGLGYVMPERRGGNGIARPIAVVVDRLATSPEAVVSLDGAREAAWLQGQIVVASQTLNDPLMEARTLDHLLGQDPAGLIYATIMTRKVAPPEILYEAACPVVLLNCYSEDRAFPSVVPSEVAGGHRATAYLVKAGHRRIATITGETWMEAAVNRLKGYRRALASADIAFEPDYVRIGNWQTSAGYDQTHALMDLARPPSAIFCANDRMAVGCYEALKERGLRLPDDVSVVGYDDEEVAQHLNPGLTTLVLPHREMGRWAVETLHATPKDGRHPLTKLECPLIERGSVGRV